VQIDGETYQLRPWSVGDGNRWWFILGGAFLQLASQVRLGADGKPTLGGSDVQAMGMIAGTLSVDQLLEFGQMCLGYTDLVGADSQGRETVVPLSSMPMHLRGRQDVLTQLMISHGRASFGGPLQRLTTSMRAAVDPGAREK
jgi:hypothetical protein